MRELDILSVGTSPVSRDDPSLERNDAWEFDLPIKPCSSMEVRDLFESLHDKIHRLEGDFARMQNQLKRSSQHDHSHCKQLAEVCMDLEKYFTRDADILITSFAGGDGPIEPVRDASPDPVRELLQNFREEIEQQGRRTEHRLNQIEASLNDLRQAIAQQHDQTLSEVKTYVGECVQNMLQRFPIEAKGNLEGSHQLLAECIATLERDAKNKLDQVQSTCDKHIEMSIQDFRAELHENTVLNETLTAKVESFQHYVSALELSVREIVAKWDSRQVQVSQSAHEAQLRFQDQQNELESMKEALQEQCGRITKIEKRPALDEVFQEIKDWLTDLEKRAVNRGGMQKQMQRVETNLAELRKDLHLKTEESE